MKDKHTYHHAEGAGSLPETWRVNPFTVPNGYFQRLEHQTVERCQHIEDEKVAYVVPSGYFEQLTDRIQAKIAEQKLKSLVSEPGFSVPEGYFADAEQQLVAEQRLRANRQETGFSVPTGYFEDLHGRLTADRSEGVRKMVPLRRLVYIAAACMVFLLGTLAALELSNDEQATNNPLAAVPDQEILQYLELYGTTDDMSYISEHVDDFDERSIGSGLSEEDIEAYLNHTL